MKLSQKQIETIKAIQPWQNATFHGNKRTVNGIPVTLFRAIIEKKRKRQMIASHSSSHERTTEKVLRLLSNSIRTKGTGYHKILIQGNTNIYYASPVHLHSDYNKSIVMPITPANIRLMNLFNSLVNKA
jgi:hypothetical protein